MYITFMFRKRKMSKFPENHAYTTLSTNWCHLSSSTLNPVYRKFNGVIICNARMNSVLVEIYSNQSTT
uniref:Uncharacterized protein n=1 Tax=Rhizophora mucronata TaxID=61149 RepID=A0A2P2NT11_RHIMU